MTLSNPSGPHTIAKATATVTITDDDVAANPPPSNDFSAPGKGKANLKKGTLTLEITLPGSGTLAAAQQGTTKRRLFSFAKSKALIKPTTKQVVAGKNTLVLKPSKTGLKKLKKKAKGPKTGTLKVPTALTFTPTGGGSQHRAEDLQAEAEVSQRQKRTRAKAQRHSKATVSSTIAAAAAIGLATPSVADAQEFEISSVADINPAGDSNSSQFIDLAGTTYFRATDGTNGSELWRTDGTAAGTSLVKDIEPGPGDSDPSNFINVAGTLFFGAADTSGGFELWKTDGTAAGTVRVKDIEPGPGNSYPGRLCQRQRHPPLPGRGRPRTAPSCGSPTGPRPARFGSRTSTQTPPTAALRGT